MHHTINLIVKRCSLLILALHVSIGIAQNNFRFQDPDSEEEALRFKLISNLVVIPVEINGVELSFVLDTGVNKPILFNLTGKDSLDIKDVRKIAIKGLGSGEPIDAYLSRNNRVKIGGLVNDKQDIYLVLDRQINFSPRLGIPIHGIIGHELMKNFVVELKYSKKKLKFYKPESYVPKKRRGQEEFDMLLKGKKPYIDASVSLEEGKDIPVKMLIDSGGSDAVWLFEDKEAGIQLPEKNFRDYLGRGLGGSIYGARSRLRSFKIGSFRLKDAKVAFPDSADVALAYIEKNRQGSLGGEILKRFDVVFNYPASKITLKKNRYFRKPFEYNMSGIEVQHNGVRMVKELISKSGLETKDNSKSNGSVIITIDTVYKMLLVPSFEIVEVREASPAALAGLQKGDILISINGKKAHHMSLGKVMGMMSSREGKRLRLLVDRNGVKLRFDFKLKKLL